MMNHRSNARFGRRTLFKGAATLAGGTLAGALAESGTLVAAAPSAPCSPPTSIVSDSSAVAETASGKIRGYKRGDIYGFRGVPYGATTAGPARFQPCTKPKPWAGLRSCMYFGQVCATDRQPGTNDERNYLYQSDFGYQGEDCLCMNIWTPALKDNKKRPVMFWVHGGGYTAGSSQEHLAYNGENLSRRGDVVVIALNHRLGLFGFLNLAEYGPQYADSVNVSQLDIVAALEWVRDNVANFGGDSSNVTIFGQSGGGGKVSTLLAMPAAKGLFHRAVVQSGSAIRQGSLENSLKLTAAFLSELNIGKSQIARIHEAPIPALFQASAAALQKINPPGAANGLLGLSPRGAPPLIGWGPTVDGRILPTHPFDPTAPALSAKIPMMIGTVKNETSPSWGYPELESMTEDELKKRAEERYGAMGQEVINACRRSYPGSKPVEVFSLISGVRTNAVTQVQRRAAQGGAPTYMYLFCYCTPIMDGRPRSYHFSEVPYVFDNTDISQFATGGTAEARDLAARISEAWLHFARTGDPNHSGLPRWPAVTPGQLPTMLFDKKCEVKNDHDRDLRMTAEKAVAF